MIEIALRKHLLAHPGIVAIVADRVVPVTAGENPAYPLIVYRRSGTAREYVFEGDAQARKAGIELDLQTHPNATPAQYEQIKQLADLVDDVLSGLMEGGLQQIGQTAIESLQITEEQDVEFAPIHGEGPAAVGVLMTVDVAFSKLRKNKTIT